MQDEAHGRQVFCAYSIPDDTNSVRTIEGAVEDHLGRVRRIIGGLLDDKPRSGPILGLT
jgi:hypothetical protein